MIVKDLSKSVVLEVKASELVVSNSYLASGYTLRFPRTMRVRYDKPWDEAMSKQDLDTLISNYANKQRLVADSATRKRKLGDVYESGSGGSSDSDDLEKLLIMENRQKKKKVRKS